MTTSRLGAWVLFATALLLVVGCVVFGARARALASAARPVRCRSVPAARMVRSAVSVSVDPPAICTSSSVPTTMSLTSWVWVPVTVRRLDSGAAWRVLIDSRS